MLEMYHNCCVSGPFTHGLECILICTLSYGLRSLPASVIASALGRTPFPPASNPCSKINTLSLEPSHERLLAASCSDGRVVILDVRQLAARGASSPAASGQRGSPAAKGKGRSCEVDRVVHTKSCQSATWAPDGSGRLLTVSFDDTLRVWGPEGRDASGGTRFVSDAVGQLGQQLQVRHNNNTGRCECGARQRC